MHFNVRKEDPLYIFRPIHNMYTGTGSGQCAVALLSPSAVSVAVALLNSSTGADP